MYRQKSHFHWGKNKNKGKRVITKLTGMENKNRQVKEELRPAHSLPEAARKTLTSEAERPKCRVEKR